MPVNIIVLVQWSFASLLRQARFARQNAFYVCMMMIAVFSSQFLSNRCLTAQSKYRLQGAEWQYQPTILPILTPNKQYLFVDRKLHPKNTFGFTDQDDVWFAQRTGDSTFGELKNLSLPRKTNEQFDIICSIAPDGIRAFTAHIDRSDDDKQMIEFGEVSIIPTKGFLRVDYERTIQIENLRAKSRNFFAKLAPDNQTLLLALERDDSFGDLDVYVSFRKGISNVFTEPKNLGFGINTPRREGSPVLSADGRTLYFSTEGRGGYGKADMFVARREDESWIRWSVPQNLGNALNSKGEDSSFDLLPRGNEGVFVSTDEREIGAGIYRFFLTSDIQPERSTLVQGRIELPSGSADSTMYAIRVVHTQSGRILAQAVASGDVSTFTCIIPTSNDDIEVYAEYHGGISQKQSLRADRDTTITLHFTKETIRKVVLFPSGIAKIPRIQRDAMCSVMDVYMLAKRITIIGHTDDRGSARYNERLSRKRAESVKHAMEEVGVETDKIIILAKGKSEPIVAGYTTHARKQNRRVEVIVE
jgi:OOP family OmpA-OmpF porin